MRRTLRHLRRLIAEMSDPPPRPPRPTGGTYAHPKGLEAEEIVGHFPHWADTRLARAIGVHRQTIKKARARLEAAGTIAPVVEVIRGDGTRYLLPRKGP